MKNIFDRLITVIVFLVSITLASCIVGLMTRVIMLKLHGGFWRVLDY